MACVVRNWGGELQTTPSQVVRVKSAEEIVEIVTNAEKYKSPVRAVGSRHSTTRCIDADGGTLLDMRSMNRLRNIDIDNLTVTVEAGMLYIDLSHELQKRDLMHFVNTEIGNLTAGAAAVGQTKDASFPNGYGNVGSYVVGVKMVTADGEKLEVNEKDNPDLMYLIRGSFGLLGIVYEVTLRVTPLKLMRLYHEVFTLEGFLERLDSLRELHQSLMMYYLPHIDRIIVEFRSYTEDTPGKEASTPNTAVLKDYGSSWQYRVRNCLWASVVPGLTSIVNRACCWTPLRNFFLDRILGYCTLAALMALSGSLILPATQTICYPEESNWMRYTFSIFSFNVADYPDTLRAYFKFVREYQRKTGWRCNMVNVGYAINRDEQSYISYTHDNDGVTIDPVVSPDEGWFAFLDAYNEFCTDHGGRPLINQTPRLTQEQCKKAFGNKLEQFNEVRKKMDPSKRFLSGFFEELFGF